MFPIIPHPNGPVAGSFRGLPQSMPTPPTSLPALPLPPWTEGWPIGGPWAASPVSLPNSALDYQTTISFNPLPPEDGSPRYPRLAGTVFVAPHASVVGDVTADEEVFIGFGTTVRADGGSPIQIGPRCQLHDRVSVSGTAGQTVEAAGMRWAVQLGEGVSCLPGSVIAGPTRVGSNVYIGAGAVLQGAEVGDHCVIHPGAVVMGVRIPANRMVEPGQAIWRQEQADGLLPVPKELRELNTSLVAAGVSLAQAYREQFPVTPWQQ